VQKRGEAREREEREPKGGERIREQVGSKRTSSMGDMITKKFVKKSPS